jgi:hypothetical protein
LGGIFLHSLGKATNGCGSSQQLVGLRVRLVLVDENQVVLVILGSHIGIK